MDPFISVDDLEAMIGENIADPNSLEVKITLDSACQRVRTYLGQTINRVDDDPEVHSGSGRRKMRLRQRPVRAVTGITIDDETIDPATYTVRGAIVTRKDSDVWWYGNDNVVVTYTHGYDHDPGDPGPGGALSVPSDIRLVALIIARRVFEAVGTTSMAGSIISETIGDYSYQLSDTAATAIASASELLQGEMFALDRYRVDLVGDTPTY